MNSVNIAGQLGKEVKLTTLPSGSKVLNNTICITDIHNEEKYTWINIIAYDKMAEYIVENFVDEEFVLITGKLITQSWIDKETKEKRFITQVMVKIIEGVY